MLLGIVYILGRKDRILDAFEREGGGGGGGEGRPKAYQVYSHQV